MTFSPADSPNEEGRRIIIFKIIVKIIKIEAILTLQDTSGDIWPLLSISVQDRINLGRDGAGRYVFDITEGIKWADFGSFFLEKLKSAA